MPGSAASPNLPRAAIFAQDIPRYRIYRNGELTEETTDVVRYFEERSDLVSFLIGCSFSFESALLDADIPVRQIEEGVNVPMYNTNIPCTPAGVFSGNMVVSMRPIPHAQVLRRWPSRRACPRARCAGADRHAGSHRHHRSGPP